MKQAKTTKTAAKLDEGLNEMTEIVLRGMAKLSHTEKMERIARAKDRIEEEVRKQRVRSGISPIAPRTAYSR